MHNESAFPAPEVLFEISWEVCNKVGGIHTVLTSKSHELTEKLGEKYLTIGPDIWRDENNNPEFHEDPGLHRTWKLFVQQQGIQVRLGYWNIPSRPVAIMVDFTPLIQQKNEILSKAWENFNLDSISGEWDFVEAALFGYAAGMVVKSFTEFYRYSQVVAHFHEWMTGMGVLYLRKESPYIATVFTTHATTTGRSLAGNGYPLYENLDSFGGDEYASRLNVKAKHSLEKLAAHVASAFATVSEVTAKECRQLLDQEPDVVTPNGFSKKTLDGMSLSLSRADLRARLIRVAESVLGYSLGENLLIIGTSGRYEFRNKGIDRFIDLLAVLNQEKDSLPVLAFILVPAHNYGPRQSVIHRMEGLVQDSSGSPFLTHNLHNAQDDQIIQYLSKAGLSNLIESRVKVIFIPAYLNGDDGVVNMHYYDVVKGMDLTLFPSYYEPWGYTPMESLFLGVPTLTTDLSGFGQWILNHFDQSALQSAGVIRRSGMTEPAFVQAMKDHITNIIRDRANGNDLLQTAAENIASGFTWEIFIKHYWQTYQIAMDRVADVERPFLEQFIEEEIRPYTNGDSIEGPLWRDLLIESALPEQFRELDLISRNLWWSWNPAAEKLFRTMDPVLWEEVENNPIRLLRQISLDRLQELVGNREFVDLYGRVVEAFRSYLSLERMPGIPQIAYFSMEYGFHVSLKVYSGGLGILAGDYLKEASDRNAALTGVGLLYRNGYFRQVLTLNGDQLAENVAEEFSNLPLDMVKDNDGQPILIQVTLPGRTVHARVWLVKVGRIDLYLLDTDVEVNQVADRQITSNLYGGDEENRLKQEMILGVGGIRMLNLLGIQPHIYHCNEGHAAFIGLERIRQFMQLRKFTFRESLEVVRASTLFTTHTPVPAGHDSFSEDLIRTYMGHYPDRLNVSWAEFIGLGRLNPDNVHERFSMSYLAARLSQEINGVSNLHGEVTRKMFRDLWKGFFPEELHVGFVTNGVHYQTWTAEPWQDLYLNAFGPDFLDNQSSGEYWKRIHEVPSEDIWGIRQQLRHQLISYLRFRLEKVSIRRHEPPRQILDILHRLDDQVLTIGFARRFATYKRAHLLFKDLDRLDAIVNNPDRPVQFLFAGKAHPRDNAGQDLIRYIVGISRQPKFRGKIIFLENYDMALARKLVQGVDVWLNTPTRPLEASGTSGMKAVMNGVLNFSVLDGWWCEGYRPNAGWSLPQERIYDDQGFQDELDSSSLYNILEEQIIPLFYNRNEMGIPEGWISYIRNNIAQIAPQFTTRRMIDDYFDRYYNILFKRSLLMMKDNYHPARDITRWKTRVTRLWQDIEVIQVNYSKDLASPLRLGAVYTAEVILRLNGLNPDEVGVELVVITEEINGKQEFVFKQEFKRTQVRDGIVRYKLGAVPTQPGIYKYGIRVFPKNDLLPNRQDFKLMKWIS